MSTEQVTTTLIRVLVVVDHEPLADALRVHLERSERIAAVATMTSSGNLLASIDAESIAVLLVDDQLDDGGLELCRFIDARRPHVDCIVLGNGSAQQAERKALNAGAAAYMVKSLSGASVLEMVHAVFDGYRQESDGVLSEC